MVLMSDWMNANQKEWKLLDPTMPESVKSQPSQYLDPLDATEL
jgi:hypothetical protein